MQKAKTGVIVLRSMTANAALDRSAKRCVHTTSHTGGMESHRLCPDGAMVMHENHACSRGSRSPQAKHPDVMMSVLISRPRFSVGDDGDRIRLN